MEIKKIIVCLGLILLIQSIYFIGSILNNSDATRIYDTAGNTTFAEMGYEYLPMNTNPQEFDRIPRSSSDNLNIKEFDQQYNRITLCLENTGTQEEFVEVPLVYYRGYKARDINSAC